MLWADVEFESDEGEFDKNTANITSSHTPLTPAQNSYECVWTIEAQAHKAIQSSTLRNKCKMQLSYLDDNVFQQVLQMRKLAAGPIIHQLSAAAIMMEKRAEIEEKNALSIRKRQVSVRPKRR